MRVTMATKATKPMSRHDMAVRLCEGGEVFFMGHWLKSTTIPDEFDPCEACEMDCLCHMEMTDLCAECDAYDKRKHILYLANKQPPFVVNIAR